MSSAAAADLAGQASPVGDVMPNELIEIPLDEEVTSVTSTKTCKRRRRTCGLDMRARDANLPLGPPSMRAVFAWPRLKTEKAIDNPTRYTNLNNNIANGCFVASDWTGMDGPRECLTQFDGVWTEVSGEAWRGDGARFTFARACDNAPAPQAVLLYLSTYCDGGRSCVFDEIEDRVITSVSELLDGLRPAADATKDEAEVSYMMMRDELMDRRLELFNIKTTTSGCLAHNGRHCLAYPCLVEPGTPGRPLVMNFGTHTCVGWSAVGGHAGGGHPSQRSYAIWQAERCALAEQLYEDVFFDECTAYFPAKTQLRAPLAASHRVVYVKAGPELEGHPNSRPRHMGSGLNRYTMLWTGPESDAAIQEDFDKIYNTTMETTGDIFFAADNLEVRSEFSRMLQLRGHYNAAAELPASFDDDDFLSQVLAPGAAQRRDAYEKIRHEYEGIGGSYLADVEHWPGRLGKGGPLFPCQLCHGTVVSWMSRRPAVSHEHLAAQGYHILNAHCSDFTSPLKAFFCGDGHTTLSPSKKKELAGNGISLPVMLAWILYVLCNSRKRPIDTPERPIQDARPEDNDDDGAAHSSSADRSSLGAPM